MAHNEGLGQGSFKRVLTLKDLLIYGGAVITPIAVFTMVGTVATMTHGMLTLVYFLTTAIMAVTGISYGRMVAAFPVSGSAYVYTTKAINPYIGFMVGWALVMGYIVLPMVTGLLASMYMNAYFPMIPKAAFLVTFVLILSTINILGVKLLARANMILVGIQVAFVLAFFVFIGKYIAASNGAIPVWQPEAIYNGTQMQQIGWVTIFMAVSVVAMVFLGFDGITTVAEETIRPEKNIGIAVVVICMICGVLFSAGAYFMQVCWPTGWMEFQSGDTAASEIVMRIAGPVMSYLFLAAWTVGCCGCCLASQAAGARIMYSLGCDGIFPKKIFGKLHPKFKTPAGGITVIGIACLAGIFLDLTSASSLVNFSAFFAFTLVNVSVIFYYFIRRRQRRGFKHIVLNLLLPGIGAIFCMIVWCSLNRAVMAVGLVWMALGLIYLTIKTKGFKTPPAELRLDE